MIKKKVWEEGGGEWGGGGAAKFVSVLTCFLPLISRQNGFEDYALLGPSNKLDKHATRA